MKDKIKFNKKDHTYYKNGIKYDSVSSIIERYFSKFDADKIAKFKAYQSKKDANILRKEGKYELAKELEKKGVRYWKNLWKKNRDYGTAVHNNIQQCIQLSALCTPSLYKETNYALEYLHNFERKLSEPYTMSEVVLFNDEYKIAGTADVLIYEADTNSMYIIDWKVVNEIKDKSYNDKKSKLGLPDSNFWKYCVQLNLYAWMLRQNGFNTPSMKLIQLTPEGIKEFNIPGMVMEINKILEDRK